MSDRGQRAIRARCESARPPWSNREQRRDSIAAHARDQLATTRFVDRRDEPARSGITEETLDPGATRNAASVLRSARPGSQRVRVNVALSS